MIVAEPKGLFYRCFRRYNRGLIQRWFAALRTRHWNRLIELPYGSSLLVLANHHSWWDGLVLIELFAHLLDFDSYAMVELPQIKAHPFFPRIGAFSIDRTNPREVLRSLRYATDLLNQPGRVVAIFPQGRQLPAEAPLVYEPGVEVLLRRFHFQRHVHVVSLAMQYTGWRSSRPEIFVQAGRPRPVAATQAASPAELQTAALQADLAGELADLRAAVGRMDPRAFSLMLTGKHVPWDGVMRQPLADR